MSGTTNVPGVCVIVRDGTKILLVLREQTGWKDGEYIVPAGHVEDDETFRQAACRELLEEVGLVAKIEDLLQLTTIHRKSPDSIRVDMYFEAVKWSGTPSNMEPERHAAVKWIEESKLPENVVDYIKFGLENIEQGKTYGEFGWGD